jgi:hypothetical protein
MLELRDLDLQLALAALGALGEDLQNEKFAVEHGNVQRPLQVALLRGAQRHVEDRGAGAAAGDERRQFLDLAAAQKEGSIGTVAPRAEFADDGEAGRCDQLARLVQGIGGLMPERAARADDDTDDESARSALRARRFDLEGGQASDSVARLTGRAGTTVEIACL